MWAVRSRSRWDNEPCRGFFLGCRPANRSKLTSSRRSTSRSGARMHRPTPTSCSSLGQPSFTAAPSMPGTTCSSRATAEHLELGQIAVARGEVVELVAYAARLVEGAPHVEATDRLQRGLLAHRLALPVAQQAHPHALRTDLHRLPRGQYGLGLRSGRRVLDIAQLKAPGSLRDLVARSLQDVHLELLALCGGGRRRYRQQARHDYAQSARCSISRQPLLRTSSRISVHRSAPKCRLHNDSEAQESSHHRRRALGRCLPSTCPPPRGPTAILRPRA